ncbi:MAG: hypothetical protein K6G57_05755 [Lachnospiraceae bacterium]|nr:hypothetical protein [Lachnospiraceae bacterium]
MNTNWYGRGITVGIVVGLIISVFVLKAMNKNNKMKTEYDEMQEKVRGKAYKYAFWTMAAFETLMVIIEVLEIKVPFSGFTLHVIPIIIAACVHAVYSVMNGAYIGLNTNVKTTFVAMVVIGAINILIAILAFANGFMIEDGMFGDQFLNLLVGLMFVIIGVATFIAKKKNAEAEEE